MARRFELTDPHDARSLLRKLAESAESERLAYEISTLTDAEAVALAQDAALELRELPRLRAVAAGIQTRPALLI